MGKKKSLKEFIDDNYPLFAAIGVTAALVALSSRLEHGESIAFVSLLMLALLDWELLTKIPAPQEASLRLLVFSLLSLFSLFNTLRQVVLKI